MRLLRIEDGGFNLTKVYTNNDPNIPPYAILSHTWGEKEDEISIKDIRKNNFRHKPAYHKLICCSDRARADGLEYVWVDTCCINQSDTNELTRAINSMFRWYQNAAKCYAYLADVSSIGNGSDAAYSFAWPSSPGWISAFRKSRWFTRGWTLQELLTPRVVEFISSDGAKLGDKASLLQEIHQITRIDQGALRGANLWTFSFDQRMAWAKGRVTKEEEDEVYSLLGIFGVFLPLIYGEGKEHAHKRLRNEIEKQPTGFHRTESVGKPMAATAQYRVFCNQCNEPGHSEDDVHCYKCKRPGHYASDPHCFTCGEYGHFAAEHKSQEVCGRCGGYGHKPQDVHCYRCGEYGHYKPDCPEGYSSDEY